MKVVIKTISLHFKKQKFHTVCICIHTVTIHIFYEGCVRMQVLFKIKKDVDTPQAKCLPITLVLDERRLEVVEVGVVGRTS